MKIEGIGVKDEEEEVIGGEVGEGGGPPIVLHRVMIEDLNQEVLMDDQGNIYDMEGHYLGKLDENTEEEQTNNQPNPGAQLVPLLFYGVESLLLIRL